MIDHMEASSSLTLHLFPFSRRRLTLRRLNWHGLTENTLTKVKCLAMIIDGQCVAIMVNRNHTVQEITLT